MRARIALVVLGVAAIGAAIFVRSSAFANLLFPKLDRPRPLPRLAPLKEVGSLSAETCGSCHRAIYDEWSTSLMAKASVNAFYVRDLAERPFWMCRNCHSPLENQLPEIVTGVRSLWPLVPIAHANAGYDPRLAREGITCVVCHMSGAAQGAPASDPPTVYNARALAGATPPHPLRVGPALTPDGALCARCHQLDPINSKAERPAADTMNEYAEYRAKGGKETCLGCHMPAIERAAVENAPVRTGHVHTFRGARDGAFMGQYLDAEAVETDAGVRVTVKNAAGHRVPTSEPARTLVLSVAMVWNDHVLAERRLRFRRDLDPVEIVDRLDTSLAVGETRVIDVPFTALERADATHVRLTAEMWLYEPDHRLALAVGAPEEALTTPIWTRTTTLSR